MNIDKTDIEVLVRDYVLDRLSDEEAEAFEEYFIDRPDIVEMVQAAYGLNMSGGPDHDGVVGSKTVELDPREKTAWFQKKVALPYVLMSTLAVIGIQFLLMYESPSEVNYAIAKFSSQTTRGVDSDDQAFLEVEFEDLQAGRPVLMITVPELRKGGYELELIDIEHGGVLWISKKFSMGKVGDALVTVPNRFAGGNFGLRVFIVSEARDQVKFCHYRENCSFERN